MIQASNVKSSLLNVIPLYLPAFRKAPTALPGIKILPKYSMLSVLGGTSVVTSGKVLSAVILLGCFPEFVYTYCTDIFSLYKIKTTHRSNETQWSPFVSFHPILLHAVREHSFVYRLVVIFLSEYTYIPRDRHTE